jgi:hypothetical protein
MDVNPYESSQVDGGLMPAVVAPKSFSWLRVLIAIAVVVGAVLTFGVIGDVVVEFMR